MGEENNHLEVPISLVKESKSPLRPVDANSADFLGLMESIKARGFIGSISVRPCEDAGDGRIYEIINGGHRFRAAEAAGLDKIPVHIVEMDDYGVLFAQTMMNVHFIETKPAQYAQRLKDIMRSNPDLTAAELAGQLKKTTGWLSMMLGLARVKDATITELIDSGKIPLAKAYVLSRLPEEEQLNWIQSAMVDPTADFTQAVKARIKELKDAARQGRTAPEYDFKPVATCRKMTEIVHYHENPDEFARLIQIRDFSSPEEAASWTLRWVLKLDEQSISEQRNIFDDKAQRLAQKAEIKEREKEDKLKLAELAKLQKRETKLQEAAKAAAEAAKAAEERLAATIEND